MPLIALSVTISVLTAIPSLQVSSSTYGGCKADIPEFRKRSFEICHVEHVRRLMEYLCKDVARGTVTTSFRFYSLRLPSLFYYAVPVSREQQATSSSGRKWFQVPLQASHSCHLPDQDTHLPHSHYDAHHVDGVPDFQWCHEHALDLSAFSSLPTLSVLYLIAQGVLTVVVHRSVCHPSL